MNTAPIRLAAAFAVAFMCVACGNKGALYLPGASPPAGAATPTQAERPEPQPAPVDEETADEESDDDRGA